MREQARSQRAGLDGRRPSGGSREGRLRCSSATARHRWGPKDRSTPAVTRAHTKEDGGVVRLPRFAMKDLRKELLILNDELCSEGAPSVLDARSFNEIVAILTEILVLDFQRHKEITVGSPPRSVRKS